MLGLLKLLRPFSKLIFIIFLLLFAQAMADLALPDFLSRIVNVGIQQNGIKNAVPEVIRAKEMELIRLFLDEDQKYIVDSNFLLLSRQNLPDKEFIRYVKQFPLLAKESLYILNTEDRVKIKRLDSILGKAIMAVSDIRIKGIQSPTGDQQDLPEGIADPFEYITGLPETRRKAFLEETVSKISLLPERMISQSAISYLAAEYKTIGMDMDSMQNSYIYNTGGLMALFALGGTACSITVGLLSARVAAGFARRTRRRLFRKIETFSNIEFDRFTSASLITRTTNDIEQMQMLMVMLLRVVFHAPIIGIGGIIMVLGQEVSMIWIIGVAVLMMMMMISLEFFVAVPRFKLIQTLVDGLNRVAREMLNGIMVIRAFNTQDHEERKFDGANRDLTRLNIFINSVMAAMHPGMMLIMNSVMLAIIWFGGHKVDMGSMQVGNVMAFMQYTMMVIMSFLMVSMTFMMMPRAGVSATRIAAVLETKTVINDPENAKKFPENIRGQIEFKDVSFKYPGAEDYVLKNITFSARPGTTTALIGGTGSGKSTLINLIPRFYDISEGSILVDNVDVREVTQHDLREKIGYVPQKTILFSGTMESNIKYGRDGATYKEIRKAAEVAQSLDFIEMGDKGFEGDVSRGGMNLSGGQQQRLSIARALAKRPEIYLFDDSFSALDFKTDALLRRAMKKETGSSTILIVAQRISTIMNADRIVVLNKGKIAGMGNHRELMESSEVYREIALSQLSEQELES